MATETAPVSTGLLKQVRIANEVTWGVPPTGDYAVTNATVNTPGTLAAPGDTLTMTSGTGTKPTFKVTATQVVSATVPGGSSGSGGTPGTRTVTGTTGVGTLFTASVTVGGGGGITAVLSILTGGEYTTNPTAIATEPVTGASLIGAELDVVMGVRDVAILTEGILSVTPSNPAAMTGGVTSGSKLDLFYSNTAAAQILRRVSSDVALKKATYRSNEIQPDRQIHDFRHGVRSVSGTIRGELSPLTYKSVFNQVLAGTFTAGVVDAADAVTVVPAVLGNPGAAATIQSLAGSPVNFQTAGFRIGDVISCSGFTAGAAANNARNLRITGITTTAATNDTLQVGPAPNNSAGSTVENQPNLTEVLVAAAYGSTGSSVTISVIGKKLVTPTPGNLVDYSFSIEHWFTDVLQSELFIGCRASRMQIQLPPTGLGTIDFDVMGKDMLLNQGGPGDPYFATPSAITTSGITASVNGIMRVNGVDYAIVTGLNFTINANYTTEAVVGSNTTPYLFPGWQDITGQLTALFPDEQLQTAFLNEQLIDMQVLLTLNNNVNTDFISFYWPSIKLTSATKDDKPGAIVGTYGFQALHNVAADGNASSTTDATTMVVQDSLA
jgi:hypothetical protein